MKDQYHLTAADQLSAWDAGKLVYSIDTSGRGADFEEPVQVLAIEVIRVCLQVEDFNIDSFDRAFNMVYRALHGQMPTMSALQQRHARWLAWGMIRDGPAGLYEKCTADGMRGIELPIQPPAKAPQQNRLAQAVQQALQSDRTH